MRALGRALRYDLRSRIYDRLAFLAAAAVTFEAAHLLLLMFH